MTKSLLAIVTGRNDLLSVGGRVEGELTSESEKALARFPLRILKRFNSLYTLEREPIDYISEPVLYLPDEFTFEISVEHLNRLARERLILLLPVFAKQMRAEGLRIVELRLGSEGSPLTSAERMELQSRVLTLKELPIDGKVFVLADDIRERWRRAAEAGIREHGGTIGVKPDEADYFVTNDEAHAEGARRMGARAVLNLMELNEMRDR